MAIYTKQQCVNDLTRGEGCLGKARPDEPVFIIVGDDITMPRVLEFWAEEVKRLRGGVETDKTTRARHEAVDIRDWQARHEHNVKIPD
jgi:hypothetical protein